MKYFPRLLILLSVLGVLGASNAVNAASVPFNQNITLFGDSQLMASQEIEIVTTDPGDFRFTLTNIGDPQSLLFPPFDVLGFSISESGNSTPLYESDVPTSTILTLTAFQTYLVLVSGEVNPTSFLSHGTFNLEVVQIIPIPAGPVPAAVWLFGTALIGFIGYGKRRKVA
jgi:hypothetical protein